MDCGSVIAHEHSPCHGRPSPAGPESEKGPGLVSPTRTHHEGETGSEAELRKPPTKGEAALTPAGAQAQAASDQQQDVRLFF